MLAFRQILGWVHAPETSRRSLATCAKRSNQPPFQLAKKTRPPRDFKKRRAFPPSDFEISRAFRPVHSKNARHTTHPPDTRPPDPRYPPPHQRHPTHDTRSTRPTTPEKLIRIPFHERPDPNREASGAAVPRRMASSISIVHPTVRLPILKFRGHSVL